MCSLLALPDIQDQDSTRGLPGSTATRGRSRRSAGVMGSARAPHEVSSIADAPRLQCWHG